MLRPRICGCGMIPRRHRSCCASAPSSTRRSTVTAGPSGRGEAEGEATVVADAEAALEKLRAEAARRELESLLSGEADANDCYLEAHAGSGGTEAQDWAELLFRNYVVED